MSTEDTHSPENSLVNRPIKDTKFNGLKEANDAIDQAMNSDLISTENEFPVFAFPKPFRDLIIDSYKSLNFPIDYMGIAILTAVSTVVGTTIKAKVKNGWYEYPSLYCCLIGNAGSNKTHPINLAFLPIKNIDKANHNDFEARFKEYQEYIKLPKEQRDSMPKKEEPKLKKSILTNFTPEVLHKRLSENLRGCTILSDEMATFFDGMNNYSKGDQIGVYLSFWNHQSTTVDRIGNSIPLHNSHPYLSIIGGLQTRILPHAFPSQKLNNGFFARFLFAFPESVLKKPINENEPNIILLEKYTNFIEDYYSNNEVQETETGLTSKILTFTPEAKDFFYQWHKENCELVNENQNTIKGEIASKFDMYFTRLALLLQIMENPKSTEIEITAVKGAKKLCAYFLECSFKALKAIQNPATYLETLPQNKRSLYFGLNEDFTTAEAVALGLEFDFQERRVKDFLKDTILFQKTKHGSYKKI